MKTEDFIKNLSQALPESQKPGFYKGLFLAWLVVTTSVLALSFYLLPIRPDFAIRSQSIFYRAETLIFFLTFLATAYVAYRSAIPGLLLPRDMNIGFVFLAAATAMIVSRLSSPLLQNELAGEMSFFRGRCGPIVFIIGGLEGMICLALARRAAPTAPRLTAFWVAISGGLLALFFVQFMCDHENFFHLAIWHLSPVVLLAGVSAIVGKKTLRW